MQAQVAKQHAPSRLAVGVDVGGTKVAAGLVELDRGTLLARRTIATRAERGAAALLDDVVALVDELCGQAEARERGVVGVGVGVAELVDREGNITTAHTIPWRGVDVRERLGRWAPAMVEADVRAHALAEARYGAGRDLGQWVYITVGTGISSCLVLDGRPYPGANGNALVLASSPITTTCTACGTLLQPVLEEFAAGPALVARYNRRQGAAFERGEQVLAAMNDGDAVARQIVGSAGEALGVAVGWLVNVLDPEAVVVGGGLGLAGGHYWERMVAAAREHIWAPAARGVPFLRAALGVDAGLIGAAAATMNV